MAIREPLSSGEFYHVYNRGVEKRDIFLDDDDHLHFVHCLFAMNDTQPKIDSRLKDARVLDGVQRECIVDLIAWSLMPNHFHLLIRQRSENGITQFLHKVCTGHAMYFNKKYKRSGTLFQGRFKARHVVKDAYFQHLPRYIHRNPVKLMKDGDEQKTFLHNYRWSSYRDYLGVKNFPSLLDEQTLQDTGVCDGHEQFVLGWGNVEDQMRDDQFIFAKTSEARPL